MVNLELFRVFYVVAKCGSLTKAAEELFISQPAVSQSIKQLENQLGGKLFIRTPKGMVLTEKEGKMMYEYVKKAILILEEAENAYSELKNQAAETIRISASDTFSKYYLIDIIAKFSKKYSQTNIVILNSTTSETLEMVKNGKADLGIVNLPQDDANLNIITPFLRLDDIFVATNKFDELKQQTNSLKDLEAYPLIMLDINSNTRKSIVNFTHGLGVHLHPEIELGTIDLLKGYALAGLGVACVPKQYVLEELENGLLFEVPTEEKLPSRGLAIITNKTKPINFVVKEFIAALKSSIK